METYGAEFNLDEIAARDTSELIQMTCPTFGDWYERFSLGMHKRMRDVVRQDRAISVQVIGALMLGFEKDWASMTEKGDEGDELEKICSQHSLR